MLYIMPLLIGIGLYLAPILYYFELKNRDFYLEKLGIQPEVPNDKVIMTGIIVFATILCMDVIACVVIRVKTRMNKKK
jgi:hypothetical protein